VALGRASVIDHLTIRPGRLITNGPGSPLSITCIAVVREITAHGLLGQLGGLTVPVLVICTMLASAVGAIAPTIAATIATAGTRRLIRCPTSQP
jgi:hypothetical protein